MDFMLVGANGLAVQIAGEVGLLALVAGNCRMMPRERVPVLHLTRCEESCALAERTGVLHGQQYGVSDELRPVGNSVQFLDQSLIGLERYDLLFLHFAIL